MHCTSSTGSAGSRRRAPSGHNSTECGASSHQCLACCGWCQCPHPCWAIGAVSSASPGRSSEVWSAAAASWMLRATGRTRAAPAWRFRSGRCARTSSWRRVYVERKWLTAVAAPRSGMRPCRGRGRVAPLEGRFSSRYRWRCRSASGRKAYTAIQGGRHRHAAAVGIRFIIH